MASTPNSSGGQPKSSTGSGKAPKPRSSGSNLPPHLQEIIDRPADQPPPLVLPRGMREPDFSNPSSSGPESPQLSPLSRPFNPAELQSEPEPLALDELPAPEASATSSQEPLSSTTSIPIQNQPSSTTSGSSSSFPSNLQRSSQDEARLTLQNFTDELGRIHDGMWHILSTHFTRSSIIRHLRPSFGLARNLRSLIRDLEHVLTTQVETTESGAEHAARCEELLADLSPALQAVVDRAWSILREWNRSYGPRAHGGEVDQEEVQKEKEETIRGEVYRLTSLKNNEVEIAARRVRGALARRKWRTPFWWVREEVAVPVSLCRKLKRQVVAVVDSEEPVVGIVHRQRATRMVSRGL